MSDEQQNVNVSTLDQKKTDAANLLETLEEISLPVVGHLFVARGGVTARVVGRDALVEGPDENSYLVRISDVAKALEPIRSALAAQTEPANPLSDAPILFGLEAQGHIPTVESMLRDGRDWPFIGRVIGWDGETAKSYYERYLARRGAPSAEKSNDLKTPGTARPTTQSVLQGVLDALWIAHDQEHSKLGVMLHDPQNTTTEREWQGGKVNGITTAINIVSDLIESGSNLAQSVDAHASPDTSSLLKPLEWRSLGADDREAAVADSVLGTWEIWRYPNCWTYIMKPGEHQGSPFEGTFEEAKLHLELAYQRRLAPALAGPAA